MFQAVHAGQAASLPVGLHYWTGLIWVAAKGDSDGHAQVDVLTALATVEPASGHVFLSYKDTVEESIVLDPASDGNNTLTSTAVPAGEIWRIMVLGARNRNRLPSRLHMYRLAGGTVYPIIDDTQVTLSQYTTKTTDFYIKEGDTVKCLMTGTVANDILNFGFMGIKFDAP